MEEMIHKIVSYDPSIHGDKTEYVLSALSLVYGNLIEDIQVGINVAKVTIMQGLYSIIIGQKYIFFEDHTTKKVWEIYKESKMINCDHPECAKEHEDWRVWLEFDIFTLLHDLIQILTGIYGMRIECSPTPDKVMCQVHAIPTSICFYKGSWQHQLGLF